MSKLKNLVSCILIVVMVLAMGTTSFASERSNVVCIDASMFSESELSAVVREAQDGVNTVIVSWEDATAIIEPIAESEAEPYYNLHKTYSLTKSWLSLGTDYPIIQDNLKITNEAGNPGAIDVCVRRPEYLDPAEQYCWGLNAGHSAYLTLGTFKKTELWLKASSQIGDYKISTVCS